MNFRNDLKTLTLDLGDGLVVDVDVTPIFNTTTVPKPRPKLIARIAVGVGDHPEGGPPPLLLDCSFTIREQSAPAA